MRLKTLLVVALVSLLGAELVTAQQPAAASPLTVVSAKRTKSYGPPNRAIRARDEALDVVLVLRVRGLTQQEFRRITDLHVEAGDEMLPPGRIATGVVDGTPELLVVTVGPKAIRTMVLQMMGYPGLRFTAEEEIVDEIQ